DALARAVEVSPLPLLVNGDVKTREDISRILNHTNGDGVLIGRAAYGNPWIFSEHEPTPEEKIHVMIEHARYHEEVKGERGFVQMRKHIGWYMNGFENAVEIRKQV